MLTDFPGPMVFNMCFSKTMCFSTKKGFSENPCFQKFKVGPFVDRLSLFTKNHGCSKKHLFFNIMFSRFFVVLASENDSKIEVFWHFFRKPRFCEICSFPIGKSIISGFGASKKRPKIDAKTHSKKTSKKKPKKPDFGSVLTSQNPPKIHPKSQKIEKNAFRKRVLKKRLCKLSPRVRNPPRKSSWGARRTIQP